jgi:hypothetical protein
MEQPHPIATLQQIASGYRLSRCLLVISDLGVADVLDETPCTAAELAAAVGAHPDALGRVLRLLSAHGVFVCQGEMFGHSSTSRLLRSDHPHSMRALVRLIGSPINWTIYEALEHAVRTGHPATEKMLPSGLWPYYQEHPEEGSLFNVAMAAKARGQVGGVLTAYDFSGFDRIGDIGGGRGHLLRAVLASTPTANGVLFDLPHVIAEAADLASERLKLQAGDFFHDALPLCDAYLVMEVIHDWGDEEAVAILKAIRRVAPPHAKLLLIEQIVPDDPGPHWAKMVDLHMLMLFGGRQRTQQEYEVLFEQASFSFQRAIDTGADTTILEAIPA